jgi:type I restriction enzyme M protein
MNTKDAKILSNLIDTVHSHLNQEDAIYLVLSLLAWNSLSNNYLLDPEFSLENFKDLRDSEDAVKALYSISRQQEFRSLDHCVKSIRLLQPFVFNILVSQILQLQSAGLLNDFDPSDVAQLLAPTKGPGALDSSLCEFAIRLIGDIHGKQAYIPWEMSGQFVTRVAKKSASAFTESQMSLSLAELVSLITDSHATICVSEPLANPSYISAHGKLKKFDVTLSMPPVGVKVDKEIAQRDMFGRFMHPSTQLATLALQHIIAQTEGKIVFITSNSMLFSAGAERQLRERIVQNGMLEAVISLPSGLMSHAGIPLTILVLDTSKKASAVRFVNAAVPYFYQQATRAKNQLIRTDELISLVNSNEDSPYAKSVAIQEIADNDMQLQVNRYVLDAKAQKLNAFMSQHEFTALGELVEIIKPIAALASEDGEPAFEVLAADVPEFGYIHTASKPVQMDIKSRKAADLKLRQDDIVLMIKGAVGKVGIVGSTNDSYWTVGPSAVILRAVPGNVDPRALALFLRSGLGQHLLKGAASGAVQPFIQLKELVTLKIPVSSLTEHMECGAILEQEEDIQTQIRRLNASLSELTPTQWQLPAESSSDHNNN